MGANCPTDGGGIYAYRGHLVLDNVVMRNNQTPSSGGAVYCGSGDLTVQNGSVIKDNQTSTLWYGGGICCQNVTLIDSTVSGNLSGSGGGISSFSGGTVTISGSTISNNETQGYDGGAIYTEGSVVVISNSTLHGNSAGRVGGAIFASTAASNVTLNGVTVSDNNSAFGDSLRASNLATMVLTNTVISGACVSVGDGIISSSGGNIESPGNTCGLTGPGDNVNVGDLKLAPLGAYGGPTMTRFLRDGSPAIGGAQNAQCLAVDQRGQPRSDGACDVGSFERQAGELDPVIFTDGFESSNTSQWSLTVP